MTTPKKPCPAGSTRNEKTGRCRKNKSNECPPGKVRNPSTNRCRNIEKTRRRRPAPVRKISSPIHPPSYHSPVSYHSRSRSHQSRSRSHSSPPINRRGMMNSAKHVRHRKSSSHRQRGMMNSAQHINNNNRSNSSKHSSSHKTRKARKPHRSFFVKTMDNLMGLSSSSRSSSSRSSSSRS